MPEAEIIKLLGDIMINLSEAIGVIKDEIKISKKNWSDYDRHEVT